MTDLSADWLEQAATVVNASANSNSLSLLIPFPLAPNPQYAVGQSTLEGLNKFPTICKRDSRLVRAHAAIAAALLVIPADGRP